MHRGHAWHDYPWPWVSLAWVLYNLQLDDVPGAVFEISVYAFGQSEKPIVSSMYNNTTNHATTYTNLMISVAQDIYSVKDFSLSNRIDYKNRRSISACNYCWREKCIFNAFECFKMHRNLFHQGLVQDKISLLFPPTSRCKHQGVAG